MDFSDEEGNDGLECSKIKATLYVEGRIKVGLQVNLELVSEVLRSYSQFLTFFSHGK
jgi:hypothetical protein